MNNSMAHKSFGFIGTTATIVLNIIAWILDKLSAVIMFVNMQILQEISYICAILVSIVTIFWYIANIMVQRKKFIKAIKEVFFNKKERNDE